MINYQGVPFNRVLAESVLCRLYRNFTRFIGLGGKSVYRFTFNCLKIENN